jgi:RNA polymerase sigma-70 factor (ECF subfamily)
LALRAALSRLHPTDRMLLVLHDGEGFAAREIGEAAGLSAAAAHKRLQRSRIKLARELAALGGPPPRASGRCLSTRVLAADYLEGLLPDAEREVVDAHLRDCPLCPPLAQAVLGLRTALDQGVPPSPVRSEVTRYLRACTEGEAAN